MRYGCLLLLLFASLSCMRSRDEDNAEEYFTARVNGVEKTFDLPSTDTYSYGGWQNLSVYARRGDTLLGIEVNQPGKVTAGNFPCIPGFNQIFAYGSLYYVIAEPRQYYRGIKDSATVFIQGINNHYVMGGFSGVLELADDSGPPRMEVTGRFMASFY